MSSLILLIGIVLLILAVFQRWRTWQTPAYYRALRLNLAVHAGLPVLIIGWRFVTGSSGADGAVDEVYRAMSRYAWGLGGLLVPLGWILALLHLTFSHRNLGVLAVVWGYPLAIAGLLLFFMGLSYAASGDYPLWTMVFIVAGFASLGVIQTVTAPVVGAVNLMALASLFPQWELTETVDFLSGAFDLFEIKTAWVGVALASVSTALALCDTWLPSFLERVGVRRS